MEKGKFIKIFLILLVVFAIPVGVYMVSTSGKTQLGIKAGRTEAAFLFLMPSEARVKPDETVDLTVKIDTGQETVGGVEIVLNFDPDFLTLVSDVRPGAAFPGLVASQGPSWVVLRGQGTMIGQGTVGTLTFKAVSLGQSRVEVDADSLVWDEGQNQNILRNTAGAKIIIE